MGVVTTAKRAPLLNPDFLQRFGEANRWQPASLGQPQVPEAPPSRPAKKSPGWLTVTSIETRALSWSFWGVACRTSPCTR